MRLSAVWLGFLCAVMSANVARAEELAAAPTTPARPSPDEPEEQPAPVTVTGPGPAAFEPEGENEPEADDEEPAQPRPQPRRFRRWTPEEIARVRAALARQRKQMLSEVHHPPGDPTAHFTLGLEVSAVYRVRLDVLERGAELGE